VDNAEERCPRPKQSALVRLIRVFPRPFVSRYGAVCSYTPIPTRGINMSRLEATPSERLRATCHTGAVLRHGLNTNHKSQAEHLLATSVQHVLASSAEGDHSPPL